MTKIHRCKLHDHPYTVCPLCGCQYCPRVWSACPRESWHPAHGTSEADTGRRYRELGAGNGVHPTGGIPDGD